MNYIPLTKLFYKDKEYYETVYQQRTDSQDSVYYLPIEIKGNQAFIVCAKELLELIFKIYHRNNKLTRVYNKLSLGKPKSGIINSYIRHILIEEILLTNNIEGVRSTRKEIQLALDNKDPRQQLRFEGLVKKYNLLLDDVEIPLNSSTDIRSLYDEILTSEIEQKNQPDGSVFRKDSVSVYSATGKKIHDGINPEQKLIEYMDQCLDWLKQETLPLIIRLAAFHYLFGYMHPFYDGNGRISRLISSYLLKQTLNYLVSLRLSYTICNRQKDYYDAFIICNDERNRGDLTPFVITFLSMVYDTIESSIASLTESKTKLDYYSDLLDQKLPKLNDIQTECLFALIQSNIFAGEPMPIAALATHTGRSEYWVRQMIDPLIESTLIKVERSGRVKYYSVNLDAIEALPVVSA